MASAETGPTPEIDGDLFGDGEEELTQAIPAVYDLRSRFTGRKDALTALERLFTATIAERTLGFAVVIGQPGIGKSRLVSELARVARAKVPDVRVLVGAAEDGAGPFHAVARLLAQRFGIAPGTMIVEARERVIAGVADILQPARVTEVAHLLAHMMRVPFDDSPVVTPLLESPQQLETRTFLALRRFLAADAERRPLVLVLENLELCGAETINLVNYLAAGLQSEPVLMLTTAQASLYDLHPGFGAGEFAPERIDLGALGAADSDDLLRELLRPLGAVPDRLLAHARSLGGSPRALQELVRLLLECECIARGPGASWRLDAVRLAETQLPRTYEQLVMARLAVMAPVHRRVLEMAATVGEVCWMDAVLALERGETLRIDDPDGPTLAQIASSGDHSRTTVAAALTKLVEHEWLLESDPPTMSGERELRFAYPILHQLVSGGVDDARRRQYHRLAAQWLELRPEGRGPAAQEHVARHLEQAGELREAAGRYRRAAEAARGAYDNDRAIRLYDRALVCVGDTDHAARIHLWHDLGSVYEHIGDFEAALGAFERMLRLSWVGASKAKAAVAFNKMGRVWRRKGDLKLSLEYLERGAELFRAAGDARGIAGSLDDVGKALNLLGRYDEAFAKITEALVRRGKGGDKRSIAASLSNLGVVQQARGEHEAAFNCHREALELRRAAGDRWGAVVSLNNLAVLHYTLGDHADARAGWTEALAEAEAIGSLPMAAMVLTNLGEVAIEENKLEEARSRLEDALEIVEDLEDLQLESECCRNLAVLENQLGAIGKARDFAERALAVATTAGLKELEGQALLTIGLVLSTSLYDAERTEIMDAPGEPPAEAYFRRGLAVLRGIGHDGATARGLELYGRYKIENGEPDAGKDLLREALAIYARLGMRRGEKVQQQLQGV
ncbi:MAG: tetratricopeptide repeat protein [Myxococcales bacterium]|nr:tetratricopeptide repeat protein [Myxococcales bacterium]